MTTKLHPCPFCGETIGIVFMRRDEAGAHTCTQVQCEGCGAIGPTWHTAGWPEGPETDKAVIAAWNARMGEAPARPFGDGAETASFNYDPKQAVTITPQGAFRDGRLIIPASGEGRHSPPDRGAHRGSAHGSPSPKSPQAGSS